MKVGKWDQRPSDYMSPVMFLRQQERTKTILFVKKHPQPIRVENEFLTLSVRAYSKKVTNEDAVYNRTHTFVSENGYGYPTPGTTDTPTRQISCRNV